MNDTGARKLTSAISVLAAQDLELTYRKSMKLQKVCYKSGICNTNHLIKYLNKLDKKNDFSPLPFGQGFEYSALNYFNSDWGKYLLDAAGIGCLPKEFKAKLDELWEVYGTCRLCIADGRQRIKES